MPAAHRAREPELSRCGENTFHIKRMYIYASFWENDARSTLCDAAKFVNV
jgi:hypothetical protein